MPIGYQCKEPGCPAIIKDNRERYCDKHKRLPENRSWKTSVKKLPIYQTARWQKLRLMKLRSAPMCEVCKVEGANSVHHIKSAREYPELQFTWSNLQSICNKCHHKETVKEAQERKKRATGIG